MELRERLARVAAARAVLREVEGRTWKGSGSNGTGSADGEEDLPLRGMHVKRHQIDDETHASPSEGPGRRRERDARSAPFTTSEERHDLRELGLEIVGLTPPDPLTLAHLGLRGEPPRRWEDVVFLDTETTGLSGGTGTYVFLLGTARIEGGELVLRQHLLQDLGAEREFVGAIHKELEAFRACASYNGKAFDLPILRTRVVLALRGELNVDETHLDLLHPARRLWRDRFGSTTLRQLEASILDEPRGNDDVAGALIPDRYFHWLRLRDQRIIEPVLRHNARDVISLVRIADRVARAVMDARSGRVPDHARAALALARIFERHGEAEPAYRCYESAYVEGDSTIRVRAALPYTRALERRGEIDRAIAMLETLLGLDIGTPSWREQGESRLRRLMRVRWRKQALATAS
ncbi:MAG: ribonuclease H-like domain-containing protein [Chloroflexi bacterium]|nr:ribonuclease H-like domain-containing protein [Chloroflexota bacterium]